MRQYFINEELNMGKQTVFGEEASHHIRDVLRMSEGDKVRLVDSKGKPFIARLTFDKKTVSAIVEAQEDESDETGEIVMCAALIKRDKWELLIQKACELGVTRIVPLYTRRCVIDMDEKETGKKLERWNKIALEACQQCNRTSIATVERPVKLSKITDYKQDINFVAYENENDLRMKDILDEGSICFAIGPEGGWEESEIAFLKENGFTCVSLGRRILRAETAGMFVLSVIEGLR